MDLTWSSSLYVSVLLKKTAKKLEITRLTATTGMWSDCTVTHVASVPNSDGERN